MYIYVGFFVNFTVLYFLHVRAWVECCVVIIFHLSVLQQETKNWDQTATEGMTGYICIAAKTRDNNYKRNCQLSRGPNVCAVPLVLLAVLWT